MIYMTYDLYDLFKNNKSYYEKCVFNTFLAPQGWIVVLNLYIFIIESFCII